MFIYYILFANSLQAMVHIYLYTAALNDSQLYTDRKVCTYPADTWGMYLDVQQNFDYPSEVGTEAMTNMRTHE